MKIIFDFDGTLVDSMPRLRALATEIIVDEYNVPRTQADKRYMACVGMSFREQLEHIFPGVPINDKVARKFYERQHEVYDDVQLHAGVIETIEFLNSTPFTYGLCSSTSSLLARQVIDKLLPEFSGIITGRDYGSKYSQLKSHWGVATRSDRWLIGDTRFDGDLAFTLGGKFVAVTHTFDRRSFKGEKFIADSIPSAIDEVLRPVKIPIQLVMEPTKGKRRASSSAAAQAATGRF